MTTKFTTGQRVRTTVNVPAGRAGGFTAPAGTLGTVTRGRDDADSYGVLLDGDPDRRPAQYFADELASA